MVDERFESDEGKRPRRPARKQGARQMANRQRIRAVRRVTDLAEALIADIAEAGGELAAIEEEIADDAYLGTVQETAEYGMSPGAISISDLPPSVGGRPGAGRRSQVGPNAVMIDEVFRN